MANGMETILSFFPIRFREEMKKMPWQGLEEIRVRIGQPMEFCYANTWRYLPESDLRVTERDMGEMLNYISQYSLYAYQEEIRQGYLTIEGGHRIGLVGQAVISQGQINGMHTICFLNVRIAQERCGCAEPIVPFLWQGETIYNTLILSAPGTGKTTCLRDCIRILSDGKSGRKGLKVGIVDERSEIAACHMGVPQKDIGRRTDVLDHCPKAQGMLLLLRSMSPQVIAVDELGREEDFLAVEQAACSGSRVLGTIHAAEIRELTEKKQLRHWIRQGMFQRFVLLSKNGSGERTFQIYDENLEQLW